MWAQLAQRQNKAAQFYPDSSHISSHRSSHLTGGSFYGESGTGIPYDEVLGVGGLPLHGSEGGTKRVLTFIMHIRIKSTHVFFLYLVKL